MRVDVVDHQTAGLLETSFGGVGGEVDVALGHTRAVAEVEPGHRVERSAPFVLFFSNIGVGEIDQRLPQMLRKDRVLDPGGSI